MNNARGKIHMLDAVTSEKDIGVTIDQQLKFSDHFGNAVKKANRVLGCLARTFRHLNKLGHISTSLQSNAQTQYQVLHLAGGHDSVHLPWGFPCLACTSRSARMAAVSATLLVASWAFRWGRYNNLL